MRLALYALPLFALLCGGCHHDAGSGNGDGGGGDGAMGEDQGVGDSDAGAGDMAGTGGRCTAGCTGGQICVADVCTCPTYQGFCNGQCIPLVVDPDNCGGC